MKGLIQLIANELVDYPEKVTVEEVGGHYTTVFELKVAKGEIGLVEDLAAKYHYSYGL